MTAMSVGMFMSLLFVALGGAVGSAMRFLVSTAVAFPFGTLTVNVAGSFVIGMAYVAFAGRDPWHPLFISGLLGGFTTFSAFSLDTIRLVEVGKPVAAMAYAGGSVVLSLAACLGGLTLARWLA